MLRRVNPVVLLGLIIVLVLSFGFLASAQILEGLGNVIPTGDAVDTPANNAPAGGATGGDPVGVGMAQLGAPFQLGSDGPGAFSCVGLMRHILRTTGIDPNAPWVPEEYLSRYAPADLSNPQPGDIIIYPGWATMYAGDGMLLNANEAVGAVTLTPISSAGAPLGAVRPGGGGGVPADTVPTDPIVTGDPTVPSDPSVIDDPALQGNIDPTLQGYIDPAIQGYTDPAIQGYIDPAIQGYTDPAIQGYTDPAIQGYTDPAIQGYIDPTIQGYIDPTIRQF
jgi:hypothetical protein